MRTCLLSLAALIATTFAGAADLPPPPPTSALKATHVQYGRDLYAIATTEIAAREVQLAAAQDVRAEVLEWARGQAITQSVQFALAANGDLTLTWEHESQDSVVHYRIYRSGDGQSFAPIATTDERRYVDSGLLVGAPYWYFVTAYNSGGESDPSNTASAPAD
jgi:hypothetical protein